MNIVVWIRLEVVKSWGAGYPICGSMHLECSWGKGGAKTGLFPTGGYDSYEGVLNLPGWVIS